MILVDRQCAFWAKYLFGDIKFFVFWEHDTVGQEKQHTFLTTSFALQPARWFCTMCLFSCNRPTHQWLTDISRPCLIIDRIKTTAKSFERYLSWILFSKNEFFTVTDGLNYIRIPRLQQVQYIISGPTFTFSLFTCTFFKLKRLYVRTFMSCAGRPSVFVHLTPTSVSKWYKYYQSWAVLSWIFTRLFPWGPDSNVLFISYLVSLVWEKTKTRKTLLVNVT